MKHNQHTGMPFKRSRKPATEFLLVRRNIIAEQVSKRRESLLREARIKFLRDIWFSFWVSASVMLIVFLWCLDNSDDFKNWVYFLVYGVPLLGD